MSDKQSSTPQLIDEFFRLEEEIIKTMNCEPLDGEEAPDFEVLRERQDSVYEQLSQKADTTWQWKLHTEAKISALGEEIKALQKTKKSYENSLKGLFDFLAFKMEASKIQEISGERRKMVIQERQNLTVADIDLTSQHYLDLNDGEKEPLVKRVYSWDKNAMKRAYKLNPDMYKKYVKEGVSKSIVFKKV